MEDRRDWLDPEEMTPEERLDRIVELLTTAARRLSAKKRSGVAEQAKPEEAAPMMLPPRRGRIPFGQRRGKLGRESDSIEARWVREVARLSSEGRSLRKIVLHLNKADRASKRAGRWTITAIWRILRRQKERGVTE